MRIRTIKPEFWMHEGLCKCSEFARLLAIALLNWSDDEGYFMANPILIRGQVFPFEEDSKKIPRAIQELSSVGWIRLGKDDQGRAVGMVINFSKHQRVDKPKSSSIKASSRFQDESKNDPGLILDDSKEERKGMDQGIGKDQEKEILSVKPDEYPPIVENLWKLFPPKSRDRSSKAKLAEQWSKLRRKPDEQTVTASLTKWASCHEWTKDGGQFAPGAHLWIKERKWESDPESVATNHREAKKANEYPERPFNLADFDTSRFDKPTPKP
jgi:hypothetical protein